MLTVSDFRFAALSALDAAMFALTLLVPTLGRADDQVEESDR